MPEQQVTSTRAGQLSPEQSQRSELFYDRKVLRAGWGILLFLIVFFATIAVQSVLLTRLSRLHDEPHSVLAPRDALANLVMAVAVTVATFVLTTREQRRFGDYGFRTGPVWRHLTGGLLTGFALLSALVLLLHQLGLLVFRGQVLFGAAQQWRLGLVWLGFYVLVAYVEEALTRGYLQHTLTRAFAWVLRRFFAAQSGVPLGFWIAGFFLSTLFALMHLLNLGESGIGILNAGLFGLLLVYSLWRTGSLWWAFGFHIAWDWAQSFLWGVPDSGMRTRDHLFLTEATGPALQSGGYTGPEGSLYTIGALVAAFGILTLLHRRRVYPELWEEAAREAGETDNMLPDPGGAPARS